MKPGQPANSDSWLELHKVIGVVLKPFGIRGELKVRPESFDPQRYLSADQLFLGDPKKQEIREIQIVGAHEHKGFWILKFSDIETTEDADKIRNHLLLVHESDKPALPDGQYYFADLIGLRVVSEYGEKIGHVHEVHEHPSANTFQLKIRGRDVMAPWIKECVLDIDLESKQITISTEFLSSVYNFEKMGIKRGN